ncbi:MAG: RraA family protein [Haloarculaceae archaeon]
MVANISEAELCERYEQLYTGVVADVLDDYGYEDQTLDHRIKPLSRDMRAAGVAYPAVGRANRSIDPDRQVRRFLRMVDEAPEDSVLVLNTNDTTAAHIGELTTTALDNNGCRGAVIEGGLRDTEFILDQGYPVFVSHRTPLDSIIRWELVDWNTTAVVGGVTVSPGDVVVADVDGVVVVPEDVAGEVLEDAEAEKDTESELRGAIEDGMSALDAYDEYGTF